MEISVFSSGLSGELLDTSGSSLFIPSPSTKTVVSEKSTDDETPCAVGMYDSCRIPKKIGLLVEQPDSGNREVLNDDWQSYSGLRLERFRIHLGRFESSDDTSLLEAVVLSGFDGNKSVRIVAERSESVHSFANALSEEFLNSSAAVHLQQVSVYPGDSSKETYVSVVEAIYPAIPRFRHLARTYTGRATSDRSAMHASLAATCNAFGQILMTFQPEDFVLEDPPVSTPSCRTSFISQEASSATELDRTASCKESLPPEPCIPNKPRGLFRRLFVCGQNS